MLIDVRCPSCKEIFQFDDTQATMFCPFCGCKTTKAVQPPPQPVAQPAPTPVQTQNPYVVQTAPPQGNATPVIVSKPTRKGKSPVSIIAFVLSFTIYFSWIGAILGIIDSAALDKKKEKNHTFSYWAIAIGSLFTVYILYSFFSGRDLSYWKLDSDNWSNSYVSSETVNTDPTLKDGTLNLEGIESMKKVSSGDNFVVYDKNFDDCIIEARWWDYDGYMSDPGVYDKKAETLGFSVQVDKNTSERIYYAYYYSEDKDFNKKDLRNPIYSKNITPDEYGDGSIFYNIDYSPNFSKLDKGYYLVVVASDSTLEEPAFIQ